MTTTCKNYTYATLEAARAAFHSARVNARKVNAEGFFRVTIRKRSLTLRVCATHRKRQK